MTNDAAVLQNERLKVEIALPFALYRQPRFDSAGIIRQVTLNGKAAFCASEKEGDDYPNGGIGLCGEFGIDGALGFADAGAGGMAVKIGVGRIKRPDGAPYHHERAYDFERLDIQCNIGEKDVEFHAVQPETNGYAYEYRKRVALTENGLKIEYRLINRGANDIMTTEYCHNFVRFNELNIGKDYVLEIKDAAWAPWPDCQRPGTFTFGEEPRGTYYYRDSEPKNIYGWHLHNAAAGLEMTEKLSEDACRFALWGTNRVISPELFVRVELKPGENGVWSREYTFCDIYNIDKER